MPWAEQQQAFVEALLAPQAKPPAQVAGDSASAGAQLAVYRSNVTANLTDTLGETFRATQALVGAAYFAQLAQLFIRQHPPTSGNLNEYGAAFPAFIAQHTVSDTVAYLADVARFERAWNRAFYAAAKPAASCALATLDADTLAAARWQFAPDVKLLALDWPADAIWHYCIRRQGEGDAPAMTHAPHYLLVHRPGQHVMVERLAAADYHLLVALQEGTATGVALENIQQAAQAPDVVTCLALIEANRLAHPLIKGDDL